METIPRRKASCDLACGVTVGDVVAEHKGRDTQMVHKYSRLVSRRSFLGGGVAALGATAAVAIPFGAQGHFYPGTTVSAIDISGKSQTAAEKTLHQHLSGFEQTAVVFKHGEKTWNASLADLGYSVDYTSTLDLAFQRGRDDGLVGRYVTWFNAGNNVQQFSLEFTRDNATLDAYLDTLASDVAIAARDARLVQDGNEIKITPDVAGSALDKDYVRTEIEASVQSATTGTIELSMIPVTASVTAAKLTPVKQDAAKLLSGPVTIVNWSFPRADVSRETQCKQLALALRDEVIDLEKGGISAVQVDEPALREGVSSYRNLQLRRLPDHCMHSSLSARLTGRRTSTGPSRR